MDNEENVLPTLARSNLSASPTLRKLHHTLESLLTEKEALQKRLSEELGTSHTISLTLGAKSLNLRWTPGLSHIVHVNSRDAKILSDLQDAKPISASKSTRSFQLPVLPPLYPFNGRIGRTLEPESIKRSSRFELKKPDVLEDYVSWSFIIFFCYGVMRVF